MEYAVNQEGSQPSRRGHAIGFGLAQGGIDRDDHVAEDSATSLRWPLGIRRGAVTLFELGKRQDISGGVAIAEFAVEAADGFVVDDDDRKLGARQIHRAE